MVRSVICESWRRSLGSGGDPDGAAPPVELLDEDLIAYREAHPLASVMPVIRRLLVQDAEADRMIVAVTDAAGRMLWVEGDPRLRSRAAGMNFIEGARWAEEVAGTNAPGTALALDHAVQIYGSEHFRRPVQPWSCSAAPVHDPASGALLDAIDITGGDHVASPHVLTLVCATVAAVESELRWQHHEQLQRAAGRRPAPPVQPATPRLEVLGCERARLTLPTGRLELSLRHSELLLLLAEAAVAGEGRTAAQLAAECHPGDAALVTVRAELPAAPAPGCGPGRVAPLPAARADRHRPRPGAAAARARLRRLGARALSRRRAARFARAGGGRGARAGERPAPSGGAAQPASEAAAALQPAAGGPQRRRRLAGVPRIAGALLAPPRHRGRAPHAPAAGAAPPLAGMRPRRPRLPR